MQTEEVIELVNSTMREVQTGVWWIDAQVYETVWKILIAMQGQVTKEGIHYAFETAIENVNDYYLK